MANTEEQALKVLNEYLLKEDPSVLESTLDDWTLTEYLDAFVFASTSQSEPDLLYIVRSFNVFRFSERNITTSEAYGKVQFH